MMNKCKICNKETKNNKFCSRSCAATFNNRGRFCSLETRKKLAEANNINSLTKERFNGYNLKPRNKTVYTRCCVKCIKIFDTTRKGKSNYILKTCSYECARSNSNFRKVIISYICKDKAIVKLESSWEVKIAKWLDSNNIIWSRPKHLLWIDETGKSKKYFPDFYIPKYDLYLDPKNPYQVIKTKYKLDAISKKYNLIYGAVEEIIKKITVLDGDKK